MIENVIPALLPVVADGVRSVINKFTGGAGAKPANVEEVIKLMEAETGRLRAVAEIDSAQGVSQWVANVRGMQRPVAVALVLAAYVGAVASGANDSIVLSLGDYAQMVTFYLFGDRTMHYMKRGR